MSGAAVETIVWRRACSIPTWYVVKVYTQLYPVGELSMIIWSTRMLQTIQPVKLQLDTPCVA